MTTQEINASRNERGIFSASNEVAGWYAISRDGINRITFYEGKYNFTLRGDVNRIYTDKGFAKRLTQLLNRGY
jgi:hypothetical protein